MDFFFIIFFYCTQSSPRLYFYKVKQTSNFTMYKIIHTTTMIFKIVFFFCFSYSHNSKRRGKKNVGVHAETNWLRVADGAQLSRVRTVNTTDRLNRQL